MQFERVVQVRMRLKEIGMNIAVTPKQLQVPTHLEVHEGASEF